MVPTWLLFTQSFADLPLGEEWPSLLRTRQQRDHQRQIHPAGIHIRDQQAESAYWHKCHNLSCQRWTTQIDSQHRPGGQYGTILHCLFPTSNHNMGLRAPKLAGAWICWAGDEGWGMGVAGRVSHNHRETKSMIQCYDSICGYTYPWQHIFLDNTCPWLQFHFWGSWRTGQSEDAPRSHKLWHNNTSLITGGLAHFTERLSIWGTLCFCTGVLWPPVGQDTQHNGNSYWVYPSPCLSSCHSWFQLTLLLLNGSFIPWLPIVFTAACNTTNSHTKIPLSLGCRDSLLGQK